MAEETTKEKLCPECRTSNPPNSKCCIGCDNYIADVPETPVGGTATEEQRPDGDGATTDDNTGGTQCPDCGAQVSTDGRCPGCARSSVCSYTLIWQDDRLANLEITTAKPVFIGRVPQAGEALSRKLEDFYPNVSRMHAELFMDKQGNIFLRDLGSCNGTRVNNLRIMDFVPQPLQPGDEIRFAGSLCARLGK